MLPPILHFSLALLALSAARPLTQHVDGPDINGPVIATDFPDPSIIHVDGTWYAFGTQSLFDHTATRVQLASSPDFATWTLHAGVDALGTAGPWVDANDPQIWAPDVYRREDGSFIMYYSALTADARGEGRLHCVGTAVSETGPEGPYHSNSDAPFACPLDRGGAIDASAFKDDDGARYVLYKIDGNARGNGGSCGNTVEPLVSTPIMIQRVADDWTTPVGPATQIIDRGYWDGPLIEAPAMIKRDGTYYLFFSSNCYVSGLYDTSYATSRSPTGGFVKASRPLLVSGTVKGTAGPGHADVAYDGVHIAFHAYATPEDVGGRRAMFVRTLNVGGDVVVVH